VPFFLSIGSLYSPRDTLSRYACRWYSRTVRQCGLLGSVGAALITTGVTILVLSLVGIQKQCTHSYMMSVFTASLWCITGRPNEADEWTLLREGSEVRGLFSFLGLLRCLAFLALVGSIPPSSASLPNLWPFVIITLPICLIRLYTTSKTLKKGDLSY
jgi:hypothetical protein